MREIADEVRRAVPLLREDDTIEAAVRTLLESGLPALPVVDASDRYVGLFGEREFITALFPGYVGQLGGAAFIPKSVDRMLEKRASCRLETVRRHMNREPIGVRSDPSDMQLAEIFLHHRVLVIPISEDGRVTGVVTRSEFFAALAGKFLDSA